MQPDHALARWDRAECCFDITPLGSLQCAVGAADPLQWPPESPYIVIRVLCPPARSNDVKSTILVIFVQLSICHLYAQLWREAMLPETHCYPSHKHIPSMQEEERIPSW
jgi:hypothetical protein